MQRKLLKQQLKKAKTAEEEFEKNKDNDPLSKHIESIENEFITGKAWKKTDGVENFAILDPKLNLFQAKVKMEKLAGTEKILLSVRGFVIDPNTSKIKAIINFANLTRGLV